MAENSNCVTFNGSNVSLFSDIIPLTFQQPTEENETDKEPRLQSTNFSTILMPSEAEGKAPKSILNRL